VQHELVTSEQKRGSDEEGWLEDLNGQFRAKLREVQTISRPSSDGKTTTTFKLARVESAYDPKVVQKLSPGQLLAIPNVQNLRTEQVFSVFEIADIIPMHYSMLTLSTGQPGALRGEFMGLIDKEWKQNSKSTWIELVASPTGYIVDLSNQEIKYERKYSPLLVGSQVRLLNKEAVRRFACYVPPASDGISAPSNYLEVYSIGSLLGVIDDIVPFTINFSQLINFHVGVFCHTGGGKSYLTSMVVRKALHAMDDLKVVVFDVSSEYGIHLLDQLVELESRIVFSKPGFRKKETTKESAARALENNAKDFYKRHVKPETLESREKECVALITQLFRDDKCKPMYVRPHYMEAISRYRTYEGLLDSFANTASEKYNSNQQASIYANDRITTFLKEKEKNEEDVVDDEVIPVLEEILEYFAKAGVKQNTTLFGLVKGLEERLKQDTPEPEELGYTLDTLVKELLDDSPSSPRLFVIDEEIESARDIATRIINDVFKQRRHSFNLHPRILFVFDEAQEFAPAKEDAKGDTLDCSKAVERLLRHGRKYHLHGWISTQRLAHLNTSALHQIHSYFVGTLPRPYDRQLVGDTFAIDDALLERTLNFAPGDWLLASYRATNTQNVPVFFHAINNEERILQTN
jgi:DNA helicase HerA-like ATPase